MIIDCGTLNQNGILEDVGSSGSTSQLYFSPESYGKINHKNHQPGSYSFSFPEGLDALIPSLAESAGQGHSLHQPANINHHQQEEHRYPSHHQSSLDSEDSISSFIPTTDTPPTSIPKPEFSELLSSTSTTPSPHTNHNSGQSPPSRPFHPMVIANHRQQTLQQQPPAFPSFYNTSHILIGPPKSPVVAPVLAESAFAQLQQHQNEGMKGVQQSLYSQQIPIDYSSYFFQNFQNLTKQLLQQQQRQQAQQQSPDQTLDSLFQSLPDPKDGGSINLPNLTRGPINENLSPSPAIVNSAGSRSRDVLSLLTSDEPLPQSVRASPSQTRRKGEKIRAKPIRFTTTTSTTTRPPKTVQTYFDPQPEDGEEEDPPPNVYSSIQLDDEEPSADTAAGSGYDSSAKYYYYPVPSPKTRSKPQYIRRPYVYSDLGSSSSLGIADYNQEEETQGDQRYSSPTSSYPDPYSRYSSSSSSSSPSSSTGYYHHPTSYSMEDSPHSSNYYYDHHLHDDIHRQGLTASGPPHPPGGFHSWSGLTGFLLGIIPLSIIVASIVPAFVSVPVAGAAVAGMAGKRKRRRKRQASALASMIGAFFGQGIRDEEHYHDLSPQNKSNNSGNSQQGSTLRNEQLYTYKTIHPVIELLVEYGVNRLEDPKCLEELFCKVVAGGKKPRSNVVQRLFYTVTSL